MGMFSDTRQHCKQWNTKRAIQDKNTMENDKAKILFLHERPWISPWIKSISNELDITIRVTIVWSLGRHQNSISTSSAELECYYGI